MKEIALEGKSGQLTIEELFLSQLEAKNALETLERSLPWESQTIKLFGKVHLQPRLICSLASSTSISYTYSKNSQFLHLWKDYPLIPQLKNKIEDKLGLERDFFNLVLCNLYRNGQDSMGFHADDEPELGRYPTIASLSLGESRDFIMKPSKRNKLVNQATRHKISLTSGSLLVMTKNTQENWLHSVPRRLKVDNCRINLTFRKIVQTSAD